MNSFQTLGALAAACVLSAATASAQNQIGDDWLQASTFGSRGFLGATSAGYLLQRIDEETTTSFATDQNTPTQHAFVGFEAILQDQDPMTPETFDIAFFDTSPSSVNRPASTPSVTIPGIPGPVGMVALSQTVFQTPVLVARGQDIHYGCFFDIAPTFPSDGLSLQVMAGQDAGIGTPFDTVGPAGTIATSLGGTLPVGGSYALNSARKWRLDLLADQAGGMLLAVTNQSNFGLSNLSPGATGLSAYAPDLDGAQPGRADDFGFVFLDRRMTAGSPVTFFLATTLVPAQPLSGILPNLTVPTSGEICSDLFLAIGAGVTNPFGEVTWDTTTLGGVPAPFRTALVGFPLHLQAVGFDPFTVGFSASPCRTVRF